MTVTSTSRTAKVSEALVQQLADCAAFQTLVGAANATLAKSYIIEDASGDPASGGLSTNNVAVNCATATIAVVRLTESRMVDRSALLTYGWEDEAEIDLVIRNTPNDTAPEAYRRARNSSGDIVDQFQALFSASAARICWGLVSLSSPMQSDEIRALAGAYICRLSIQLRDIP
jgi:hypothetical protein